MIRKITVILISLALYGCTNSSNVPDNDINNAKAEKTKKDKNHVFAKGNLHFSEPRQIDNSAFVMYQLDFPEKDQDSGSGSFISKSDRRPAYWNIIFLNSETHQYHLLDSSRKMRILSVNANRDADDAVPRSLIKSNYIFYSITTDDVNKDGKLGDDDPDYLFISDKTGNNLKQISPAGYDVRSWKLISETNKVFMETVIAKPEKDDDPEIVPFTYDLASGAPPQKVFAPDFINKTKALFNQQWKVKE